MGGTRPVWQVFACLLLVQSLSVSSASSETPKCRQEERSALLAFKKSFFNASNCRGHHGPRKMESWKNKEGKTRDCCEWEGIECDEENGYVIGLDLNASCLTGTIDSEASIFDLVHLKELNLAYNSFYPSLIPSALGRLTSLTRLNLSFSGFVGEVISEFTWLTNLSSLDLSLNRGMRVRGFEELLRSLNKIEELDLRGVTVSSHKVPRNLANMTSIRLLTLSECGLAAEFPESIFALPRLEFLDVSGNDGLTGHLLGFHHGSQMKSLVLSETNFSGELPTTLGNISSLTHLDLRGCRFWGEIPSSIGDLTKLTLLDLSNNKLQGEIPASLANLTSLTSLLLGGNKLSGEVPSSLGNLIRLHRLDLKSNQLTGKIPPSLMHLVRLSVLNLGGNMLTGNIPYQIANLTRLTVLGLSFNGFHGPLPSSIYQLRSLNSLFLDSNNLTGVARLDLLLELQGISELYLSLNAFSSIVFPESNASVSKLKRLRLASCSLTEVPQFLKHQDRLRWLDLSNNSISGQVPTWLLDANPEILNLPCNNLTAFPVDVATSNWKSTRILNLRNNYIQGPLPIPPNSVEAYLISDNRLSGEIPSSLCELENMEVLDLADNNLTGPLPPCFGNFSSGLTMLSLRGNNFHGEIPPFGYDSCTELKIIDLSSNSFQGLLPRSLANCHSLQFVNFGRNNITDSFPFWLGSLPLLKVLILRSNHFHRAMKKPQPNLGFPSLKIIDLSVNNFRGKLPANYFAHWQAMKVSAPEDATYLDDWNTIAMAIVNKGVEMEYRKFLGYFTVVDLSSNNFSGIIPESIGHFLLNLRTLNLSNNALSGPIPISLANLTNLEVLDLSTNRLSGEIPDMLTQLTFLVSFNVSYNNLSGAIPLGYQFNTFDNSSYRGNPELRGSPLTKKCGNPAPDQEKSSMPFEMKWITTLIGLAGGLVTGVALEHSFGAGIVYWLVKKWRRHHRITT